MSNFKTTPKNFNPRTREGCDYYKNFLNTTLILFQSTHPRGVRLTLPKIVVDYYKISIHAPARGATDVLNPNFVPSDVFQSTHPRGVRHKIIIDWLQFTLLFQSTHPRGVRLDVISENEYFFKHFNPRTREGCDKGRVSLY